MAKRRQSVSVQEEDAFRQVIDEIIEEVVWHPTMVETGLERWLLKMVDYNVPLGKQLRGRGVISAFKSFSGSIGKDDLKPIYILGWCVELFAASFYIAEDIMKRSVTRRGQLCWHLVDGVGKLAITDAFLLQDVMYFTIDKHFKGQPCHKYLVALFHKCFFNTSLGQNLDFRIAKSGNFGGFTEENYNRVAKYKAGYFTFYLPMAIGKIMSDGGDTDDTELKMVEDIAVEMGQLYLVQDDYIDCFGNSGTTGRCASKLQGNFSSWFIIQALARANAEEEKLLKENYGKVGTEKMHRVIKLFRDMKLVEEYRKYEMKCYQSILKKISRLPDAIPALYFSETLDIIMKREN